jgi:hypothetical protein
VIFRFDCLFIPL